MNEYNDYLVDKRLVRESFDKAAPHYDEVAVLQREVSARMLERLELVRMEPTRILDIGAGTGHNSLALLKHYKKAEVISADIAMGMLHRARSLTPLWRRWFSRQTFLCADVERLPLADASVDMVFSNLTLQWCTDLEETFREIRRVLKPGGLLMFSTFGPDTLKELRASWAAADGHTHVNAFLDMHDVGDAMVRAQLAEPVMDVEYFTLTYPEVRGLLGDLKTLGAHNVTGGRARALTGKQRFKAMLAAYEGYRDSSGVLPATYEVVYGHAWAPEGQLMQKREGDTTTISLSQVRAATRKVPS